jgi:hypothetical protein
MEHDALHGQLLHCRMLEFCQVTTAATCGHPASHKIETWSLQEHPLVAPVMTAIEGRSQSQGQIPASARCSSRLLLACLQHHHIDP